MMRLSVKVKLGAAFGVVIVLTATVGGVAYVKLSALNDTVDRILEERVAALQIATTVKSTVQDSIRLEKNAILDPVDANVAKDVAGVKDLHAEITKVLAEASASMRPEMRPYIEKIQHSFETTWATQQKTLVVALQNSQSKAHDIVVNRGISALDNAVSSLAKLADSVAAGKATGTKDSADAIMRLRNKINKLWSATLAGAAAQTTAEADKLSDAIKPLVADVKAQEDNVRAMIPSGFDNASTAVRQFLDVQGDIANLAIEAGNVRAIDVSMNEGAQKDEATLMERVSDLVTFVKQKLADDQTSAASDYNQARNILIGVILLSVIVAVCAGAWIAFAISRGSAKPSGWRTRLPSATSVRGST